MQVERENLRLIATPHILSTEKGRIDVMRPAGERGQSWTAKWRADLIVSPCPGI